MGASFLDELLPNGQLHFSCSDIFLLLNNMKLREGVTNMKRMSKSYKLVTLFCATSILTSCNVNNRPKYGSPTTKEFETYESFVSYIEKQDSLKKTESFPLFDFSISDAISTKYYIEGIDITGQYKRKMSKEDYEDMNFYVFMHRYCYINNFFSDENFLVLGFNPIKDLKSLSISELYWEEIYGNLYDKYGDIVLDSHDASGYFVEATTEDRNFFMYEYIDKVKYGLALRNEQNVPIAYLFTSANSFSYMDSYKTIVSEKIAEVLKNV